jgi:Ca-activated chloride channel homolog
MTRTWLALAVASAAFLVQQPPVQSPMFRSAVDLVRVDVLVTDQGRPITGLAADEFDLFDSGTAQKIETVVSESDALDIVLALDVSGSVEGEPLAALERAVKALVVSMNAGDRAQLVTFSHRVAVPTPLTNDVRTLLAALTNVQPSGSTSLADALYVALSLTELGVPRRRSMVMVFSDGRENRSWLSADDVLQVARDTDTVIYAVAPQPHGPSRQALEPDGALLSSITKEAGGRVIRVRDATSAAAAFVDVLREMRSRYVLAYYPRGVPRGGWHPLKVTLRNRRGEIQARAGYTVTAR